jgi:hypothetical protein
MLFGVVSVTVTELLAGQAATAGTRQVRAS